MGTAEWIALAAAIAAFVGLIPQFAQMVRKESAPENKGLSDQSTEPPPTANGSAPPKPVKLNALGKALLLTSMGVAFGVFELIMFGAAASLAGVDPRLATMPTLWAVAFYSMFLIPGVFLTFAIFNIVSVLD